MVQGYISSSENIFVIFFLLQQKNYYQVIHELSPLSEVLCRHMFRLKTSYTFLQQLSWLRVGLCLLAVTIFSWRNKSLRKAQFFFCAFLKTLFL